MKKQLLAIIIAVSICCTMIMPVGANKPDTDNEVKITITDAMEIFKHLARMDSIYNNIKVSPTIADAMGVLKYLARISPRPILPLETSFRVFNWDNSDLSPSAKEIDFQLIGYTVSPRNYPADFPLGTYPVAWSLDEYRSFFDEQHNCHNDRCCETYDDCRGVCCGEAFEPIEIDEDFFEDKAIIIIPTGVPHMGARIFIDSITKEQDSLVIRSTIGNDNAHPLAPQQIRLTIAVNRSDLEGVKKMYQRSDFGHIFFFNVEGYGCGQERNSGGYCCDEFNCRLEDGFYRWVESKKYS